MDAVLKFEGAFFSSKRCSNCCLARFSSRRTVLSDLPIDPLISSMLCPLKRRREDESLIEWKIIKDQLQLYANCHDFNDRRVGALQIYKINIIR